MRDLGTKCYFFLSKIYSFAAPHYIGLTSAHFRPGIGLTSPLQRPQIGLTSNGRLFFPLCEIIGVCWQRLLAPKLALWHVKLLQKNISYRQIWRLVYGKTVPNTNNCRLI